MSNFSSSSPLLLFKSKSFRRHRDHSDSPTRIGSGHMPDGVDSGSGGGASALASDGSQNNSPHRLRRVFTTHACRRRPTESKTLGGPPGHASPVQFRRMTCLMKKPLGIAHSVPLGVPGLVCGPLNFNRLEMKWRPTDDAFPFFPFFFLFPFCCFWNIEKFHLLSSSSFARNYTSREKVWKETNL